MVVGSFFFLGGDDFFLNAGLINGANQKSRIVFLNLMIGAWALHWEFSFLVSYMFFTSMGVQNSELSNAA